MLIHIHMSWSPSAARSDLSVLTVKVSGFLSFHRRSSWSRQAGSLYPRLIWRRMWWWVDGPLWHCEVVSYCWICNKCHPIWEEWSHVSDWLLYCSIRVTGPWDMLSAEADGRHLSVSFLICGCLAASLFLLTCCYNEHFKAWFCPTTTKSKTIVELPHVSHVNSAQNRKLWHWYTGLGLRPWPGLIGNIEWPTICCST